MHVDDANSEQSEGYRLFNALVGLDVFKNSLFNLLFSAGAFNNITDETYVAFVNINSARQEFYEAGLPRNFRIDKIGSAILTNKPYERQ
ncbi:MAG: hypothetical protein R3C41_20990 [Calditrichia bacterium]